MKRGAERQIQREDGEDPHDVEGDSEGTSSVETESRELASRPIRGLPKKKIAGSPSTPAQTISSSPFSFSSFNTTQQSKSTAAPTFTSTGSPSFSPFTPSASSTSSSTSSSFTPKAVPFSFSSPSVNSNGSAGGSEDDIEYYLKLRGLNISLKSQLVEVISKEVEKDPFVNLADLLRNVGETYSTLRGEVDIKSKRNANTTPSSSTKDPSVPLTVVGSSSAAINNTSKVDTPKFALKPTAPSFTPPKVPTGGGFTFAGSSFSAPATSKDASTSKNFLPGQPTFSIPSSGFYSSFGKGEDQDEEEGDKDAEEDQADGAEVAGSFSVAEATKNSNTPASILPSSVAAQSPSFSTSANAFGSSTTSNPKPFSFNTPSTAPFSFGSAASRPNTSTTSNEVSPDKAFRFSFGTSNNANQNKMVDEGEKSTDSALSSTGTSSSATSSSPLKAPSIGSNFANTSGVKQGGAFTFGSSKINFGTPSSSSTFGNSTGFTFGSSPTRDTNANDGGK